MESDGLRIEYVPAGRSGNAMVTARLGDDVLAVESFNLTKVEKRKSFLDALCEKQPGIDREALERELLKAAADVACKPEPAAPWAEPALTEIDASGIVRPERIILPEVSAVAIPTTSILGGKPMGRYKLYLRWTDGRREEAAMLPAIDLPEGRRVWVHPEPAEPGIHVAPGWSFAARQEWLNGANAPEPAELFQRLLKCIGHYIDLPKEHAPGIAATIALWVVLTYGYQAWDAVPYLFVGGPLGSGKSRVFEILARLVFRCLSSSNMTAAALFRTLHDRGGTLLLDEAERLKQTQSPEVGEILSMLLAGYKRGGAATRLEAVGDTYKPVSFDVFGPKALACIAGLPPALASRCIMLTMFRAAAGSEKPRRRIDAHPAAWQAMRDDLHALALEHGSAWLELAKRTDVCPRMHGRDFELWQPLLALASWIESSGADGLLELVRSHALKVIEAGKEEGTPEVDEVLLRALADAVRGGDRPTTQEILKAVQETDPSTFKHWHPRTVAARLKTYGIPSPRKIGGRREFRDVATALQRVQTHYGVDLDFPSENAGGDTPAESSQ